jgi:hypothetical protein
MGFQRGEKVVCIDDSPSTATTMSKFETWPKEGEVYRVRDQRPSGAEGGVLLEELRNPPVYFAQVMGKLEPAFNPARFRRMEEQKSEEEAEEKESEEAVLQ